MCQMKWVLMGQVVTTKSKQDKTQKVKTTVESKKIKK